MNRLDVQSPIFDVRSQIADRRSHVSGFTLVELMVAVAVTTVLILAISSIFSNVSEGVTIGIANGGILANNRVVAKQIERDFREMVGPDDNGFLVIVNQIIGDPSKDNANDNDDVPIIAEDLETGYRRDVRTDQLVFIRRRADEDPITPQTWNTYDSSSTASYCKVWYGHPLRANPDGTRPDKLLGESGGLKNNHLAGNWILGRQALFLNALGDGGKAPTAHANGFHYDAPVVGIGAPSGANRLRDGTTDVAIVGLTQEAANGAMVGDIPPTSPAPKALNDMLWRDLGANEYATRAYKLAYLDTGTTPNDSNRLLCNPVPAGETFDAWRIAQMHPYLAGHVSDFVVEFAGDYTNAKNLKRRTGLSTPLVVTGNPDGELDMYDDGTLVWYGLYVLPPTQSFATGASTDKTQKPIAQNITTPVGPITRDMRYVFRHGPGYTNWPHLIRIRYRLLDHRGKIRDEANEPGRWFELVLAVPRVEADRSSGGGAPIF